MSGTEAAVLMSRRPASWLAVLAFAVGVASGVAQLGAAQAEGEGEDPGRSQPVAAPAASSPGGWIERATLVALAAVMIYQQVRGAIRAEKIKDDEAGAKGLRGELKVAQEALADLNRKVTSLQDRNAATAAEYKGRLEAKEEHAGWLTRINTDLREQIERQAQTLKDLANQVAAMATTMDSVDRNTAETKQEVGKQAAKTRRAVAKKAEEITAAVTPERPENAGEGT